MCCLQIRTRYIFTGVCHSVHGGACVVAWGGVHGCSGGHAWLLQGGLHGCSGGVGGMHGCSGGMHGYSGGHVWLLWGVCMVAPRGACIVAPGGHAWLLWGGMRGVFDEIRSMSGWYASYWNAFLFSVLFLSFFIFTQC